MSSFGTYLQLGFEHISDLQGFDHMLFIITLCAVYRLREWKKILVLVTAFTAGHSLTLALSALDIIRMPADLVELLIPVTIFLVSIHNVTAREPDERTFSRLVTFNYTMALIFGFVHGMGFSNYFRALMMESADIVLPLFAFNVGIELGQILIVLIFFTLYKLITLFKSIVHREWNLFISGAGAGVSLILILEKILEM